MSIGTETPEWKSNYTSKMRLITLYWLAASAIAVIYIFGIVRIWEPRADLGPESSPERYLYYYLWNALIAPPAMLFGGWYYMHQNKWLAEDIGVPYEEGKIYPCFTPKRLVAIALGIAFFGLSGIVPAGTFDFPQFAATFMTVLYGPFEGGLGVWIGGAVIRGPIFSGQLDPIRLVTQYSSDGAIYFILGNLYRRYIYYRPARWKYTLGLAAYTMANDRMHGGWFFPGWFLGVRGLITRPWDAWLVSRVRSDFYSRPFSWLPNCVLAYLVAVSLEKYRM